MSCLSKFSSCDIVSFWPRMSTMLYLAKSGLKSVSKSVSTCCSPTLHVSPHHGGACPMWGQKEVSTQQARCWISCYFSRPTRPNLAQDGVQGALGTGHAGLGQGSEFPVFYPFATWSPIERSKTLRANRRVARLWALSQAPGVLSPHGRRGREF